LGKASEQAGGGGHPRQQMFNGRGSPEVSPVIFKAKIKGSGFGLLLPLSYLFIPPFLPKESLRWGLPVMCKKIKVTA
jgi:hypothetical protein